MCVMESLLGYYQSSAANSQFALAWLLFIIITGDNAAVLLFKNQFKCLHLKGDFVFPEPIFQLNSTDSTRQFFA